MKKHAYKQLLLGMIAMLIVMSISRFAYTPILPFMQQDTSMDNQEAGFLATWNYLGYLVGAVIPIFYIYKTKVIDLKIYLALNIISTILMGFTEQYLIWSIFRLISGITSGTVFVLTSNIVLDSLKKIQREGISGVLYSAVGLGIFLSSIYLYFFASVDSWKMVWFVLGIVSLVLGLIVLV
ncbi:TPA: YbfB/YjiJ family MFS transporter, partial [Staphylococcus aureus]|nr:YbfB/YjiJ family MFS transporter [Staphylococcus aureus]